MAKKAAPKEDGSPDDPRLAAVTWWDAWSTRDCSDPKELRDSYPCTSVGYLLRDDEVVSVAQTKDPEGFQDIVNVPRAMVKKVKFL